MQTSANRKTFLLFLLMLVTNSAWAEWVKVGTTAAATMYIDKATIRKDDNLRKFWSIADFKQRQENGAMSSRAKLEFDCKSERLRSLAASSYSEPMAGGTLIVSENLGEWNELPPRTFAYGLMETLCAN